MQASPCQGSVRARVAPCSTRDRCAVASRTDRVASSDAPLASPIARSRTSRPHAAHVTWAVTTRRHALALRFSPSKRCSPGAVRLRGELPEASLDHCCSLVKSRAPSRRPAAITIGLARVGHASATALAPQSALGTFHQRRSVLLGERNRCTMQQYGLGAESTS